MPQTTVYQYREVDPDNGRVIISFCKMTAEAILARGAQVIADTAQDVQSSAVDAEGRYFPN